MKKAATVESYIAVFPAPVAKRLRAIRAIIKKAAPDAEEQISYGMPAYKLGGVLIYFGGYEKHIGIYPYPTTVTAFKKETAKYKTGTGSIQFPHDKPLPLPLLGKIMRYRVAEQRKKNLTKKLKKKSKKTPKK